MAHRAYKLENGNFSIAFTGVHPWHDWCLEMPEGAPIEDWIKAVMDWSIKESMVLYLDENDEPHAFDNQKVLYRSDNGNPLHVVSDGYHVSQPIDTALFFHEEIEKQGWTLETLGSVRGGRRIWALARINDGFTIGKDDRVIPYALFADSCDKSLSRTLRLTETRAVCDNTIQMAYMDDSYVVKRSHMSAFDKEGMKEELSLLGEVEAHQKQMASMATASLSKEDAVGFFLTLLSKKNKDGSLDISGVTPKALDKLYTNYKSAPGADMETANNTLWGAVNAVSYSVDHNPNARSNDTRVDNAMFGQGQVLKSNAYNLAVEVVEEKVSKNIFADLLTQPVTTKEGRAVEDYVKDLNIAA